MFGKRRARILAAGSLVLPLVGCFQVPDLREFREAWRAEQIGEYHRAYELYCQAAASSPGSRLVAMGLGRTAHPAASYWEDRAHQAVDRGDYAEAWQLFMRVLEIRPDHPSAPYLLRRLERDHAQAVAPVRLAWSRRGEPVAVAAVGPPTGTPRTRPAATGRGLATEASRVTSAPGGEERRVVDSRRLMTEQPVAKERDLAGESRPPGPPGTMGGTQPSIRTDALAARPALQEARPQPPDSSELQRPGSLSEEPSAFQFLVVRTLSKKDRKFPNKVEVLDGLVIELRDTDDDPKADLSVHLGARRIAKLNGLRIGEPRTVAGRSGRVYEIVVLTIVDNRQTVRVGIRPSRQFRGAP